MERDGLLIPLVQRWVDEIHAQTSRQQATAIGQATGIDDLLSNLEIDEAEECSSSDVSLPLHQKVGGVSTPPQNDFLSSATSIEVPSEPQSGNERYDIRPRETDDSVSSILGEMSKLSISQQPLSEFCPHISDPLPRDSVRAKLSSDLQRRDFETGAVYMFERDGSPGFVKIGWTALSIESRGKDWATHGYEPRFLFKVLDVPHAQRAETLTHFELIKEWRQEVKCRAEHCLVKHQEWFEVSKDKAQQVLGDWADFMIRAQPYNQDGTLNKKWRKIIDTMEEKGEALTAARMVEHFEVAFADDSALVEEPANLNHAHQAGHAHDLDNQRTFADNMGSDIACRESLPAEELDKVSLELQASPAIGDLPFTQVSSSQVTEGKLTLDPKLLPSTRIVFQTSQLASPPFKEMPAFRAEQKQLPSFASLREGSGQITNIRSRNLPIFSGKPMFQFGEQLIIEAEPSAPFDVKFGGTSFESDIPPSTRSSTAVLQLSDSQVGDSLFQFRSPPETNSSTTTSGMFQFGKPLLSSTWSFATGPHAGPSQSPSIPLEKPTFQFCSPPTASVSVPLASSVQTGSSAYQVQLPQIVASTTALQLAPAHKTATEMQSGTSSTMQQSSPLSILPNTHPPTCSLQVLEHGPLLIEESVPVRPLTKSGIPSQQPQLETTSQLPTERTVFQFGSTSNTILPSMVEAPSGNLSTFARDSIFQFRASSTLEPKPNAKTASSTQNPLTEHLVLEIESIA